MNLRSSARRRRWQRSIGVAIPLALSASLLTVPAVANAVEPVSGGQTSGDVLFPNVGNSGYDATHYDIAMSWTPGATLAESSITATATMTATAAAPLDSFSLDFEGLTIDSVKVNGEDAVYIRDIDAATTKYKLVIFPEDAVEGEFTTEITYHGIPTRHVDADGTYEGWNVTADGATFLGQPIGAMTGYPHNNTPSDKATYRIKLDIPTEITNAAGTGNAAAVSIGNLVSSKYNEDQTRRTWDWRQTVPTASELVLISIGKYDVIEGQVTLSSGKVIPEWSFMDSALSAANKTTITNRRAQLGQIIRNLETIYGPYPATSTGVVVDTVPSGINYALETQDRPFFPSANSVNGSTLIHELIHMWYGNAVSPKVWNDIWINEGMATWGPTHYNNTYATGNSTETTYFNSWNSVSATSGNWTIPPAGMTESETLYEYQSYTRSAQMWEALKGSIGDEAFFSLVKRWISDNRYTSQGTEEFIALAEEVSGKDLTAFFQDWIYDADKPAWVQKHEVSLAASPESTAVRAGQTLSYTLTATNTGRIPLTSAVVTADLKNLLASATVKPGSLPDGLTLEGSTLTWQVPETAATGEAVTASVSFDAVVKTGVSISKIALAASPQTLGASCVTCAVSYSFIKSTFPAKATVKITGTKKVGKTLKAKATSWGSGVKISYKWTANGKKVGKNSSSLKLTKSMAGKKIKVTVTATKPGFTTKSVTSKATAKVKKIKK